MSHKEIILLSGPPGVGKTTLMIKLIKKLKDLNGIQLKGFYTQECRQAGVREGFDIIDLIGNRSSLARISHSNSTGPTVGKYTVDVESFESIALPSLSPQGNTSTNKKLLYVVDEIGKMEMFSIQFKKWVQQFMKNTGDILLATIPHPKGNLPLEIQELRGHPRATIFEVTKSNRDEMIVSVFKAIQESLQSK